MHREQSSSEAVDAVSNVSNISVSEMFLMITSNKKSWFLKS